VPVTITNNGASPQELFLDPRLDTDVTMTLPTIPPSTSTATLPNTGQFPEWFVPTRHGCGSFGVSVVVAAACLVMGEASVP
jgi:hypothetical protein